MKRSVGICDGSARPNSEAKSLRSERAVSCRSLLSSRSLVAIVAILRLLDLERIAAAHRRLDLVSLAPHRLDQDLAIVADQDAARIRRLTGKPHLFGRDRLRRRGMIGLGL